eukprot:g7810.t1
MFKAFSGGKRNVPVCPSSGPVKALEAYDLEKVDDPRQHVLVDEGVLDKSYVDWVNCDTQAHSVHGSAASSADPGTGSPWTKFRKLLVQHLEEGRWNYGEPSAWVRVENLTLAEHMASAKRTSLPSPAAIIKGDMVAWIIQDHLYHLKSPGSPSESFAGGCLQGLMAALGVFGRALHVLGQSPTMKVGDEDGFLLWRLEMGFLIAGMLLGEGLSLLDLTSAPGWPGLNTRFFEQLLHRPLKPGDFNLPAGRAEETAVLGAPVRTADPKPTRMPVPERLHCATDPQGVTSWGKVANARMAARGHALRVATESLPAGVPFPWRQLGFPYQVPNEVREPFVPGWARQVRMLSIISNHGALDLEIPELLRHLFPQWLDVRFVLGGSSQGKICEKTDARQ